MDVKRRQVSLSDLQGESDKLVQNHSTPRNTATESQKICVDNQATPITKFNYWVSRAILEGPDYSSVWNNF